MSSTSTQGRWPLSAQILTGMAVGLVAGLTCNMLFPPESGLGRERLIAFATGVAAPIGQIFLRLIFMIVVPLIFTALTLAVCELGDVRALGRIGIKTLLFTIIITGAAVVIGMGLVNFIGPGRDIDGPSRDRMIEVMNANSGLAGDVVQNAKASKGVVTTLVEMIPRNPLGEMASVFMPGASGNAIIGVMFFAILFGVAMGQCDPVRVAPLRGVLEGVYDVTMKIIGYAMKLAPLGVGALIFVTSAQLGLAIVGTLLKYVAVVIGALLLHMLVTYPILIKMGVRRSPLEFYRAIREVIITAFSTSSSNATLPVSLRVAQEKLGIRKTTAGFVLTVGSTANQNGTALYEGVTVLFLAQFFGVDLTLLQQLGLLMLGVLAGIGTAGVPGGSLPLVVAALITFGINPSGIAIIIGVDRLLDMCRTVVNVVGDLVLAAWVDESEKNSEKTAA